MMARSMRVLIFGLLLISAAGTLSACGRKNPPEPVPGGAYPRSYPQY